jgi:hypothetical protein
VCAAPRAPAGAALFISLRFRLSRRGGWCDGAWNGRDEQAVAGWLAAEPLRQRSAARRDFFKVSGRNGPEPDDDMLHMGRTETEPSCRFRAEPLDFSSHMTT